ncbi:PCI domain-containing protein 2-like [Lytechinus pictus]|uniref:PCI domain-containing protein 2-like n=1 Tax=Lytechinus pictus TaxID=7653 RepID=UPI0030B9ED7B
MAVFHPVHTALGNIKIMAHTSLNQYLQQVENGIKRRDGSLLADHLSFKHPHIANPRLQLESPEEQCEQWFEPPYDEMVAAHLKCCWCVANHDFIEAYSLQKVVVQAFNKAFQSQKDENWALPVLYVVIVDLRLFANSAETQLSKKGKGKPGELLEKAADTMMACFRTCAADGYVYYASILFTFMHQGPVLQRITIDPIIFNYHVYESPTMS